MTPEEVTETYQRVMAIAGETIIIRRYTGKGEARPYFDTPVRGRVTGYDAKELTGTILQGDRKVIMLLSDLIEKQFPQPVKTTDRAVVRGVELAITSVDDSTRRHGTTLIAYELQVRGK